MSENVHIPDIFEQSARINELRDIAGLKKSKLEHWLAFQRAIIEYYEPILLQAKKTQRYAEELEIKKREVDRLSQGSLFDNHKTFKEP